ncbi:MAG: hypothetical protein HC822_14140, partial [Oscillochloris sp.]|nr:hypothetical protein [Oscillochloris sp.]
REQHADRDEYAHANRDSHADGDPHSPTLTPSPTLPPTNTPTATTTPTPTPPPAISVSLSAVKHYNPNSIGSEGLFLVGRVYTSIGSLGVANKSITVRVSYTYGGVSFNDTITLGPTDANGFARVCPARSYPASVQLTISTDPVDNSPGAPGSGLGDVQVQNQPQGAVPGFCQ